LFAEAKIESIKKVNNSLVVNINISEGMKCNFEQYLFEGNKITTDNTILKLSQIETIPIINLAKILQIEENIRSKEYIRDCHLIPLNNKTLLLKLEEDKMTYFSGLAGYDNTQENNSGLNGFLNLRFMNIFGTDRTIEFNWNKLTINRNSIELKYHDSGPIKYPFAGDFSILREEVDSTYIRTKFYSEIYIHTLRSKYGILFGFDDIFPGTRRPFIIEKNLQKNAGLIYKFDNRDYKLNPIFGSIFSIKYYGILLEKENVSKLRNATEINLAFYQRLFNRTILSTEFTSKMIDDSCLEDYEKFEMGGSNSLRGFQEHQFSGHNLGWFNIELRRILSRDSRIFLFLDYGYVEYEINKNKEMLLDLFGIGIGLRMKTKIGLLKLDYAFNYNHGVWKNPIDGIIHFGIETKL